MATLREILLERAGHHISWLSSDLRLDLLCSHIQSAVGKSSREGRSFASAGSRNSEPLGHLSDRDAIGEQRRGANRILSCQSSLEPAIDAGP